MELYHLAVFVLLALIFLQLCRSDNVEKMSHKSCPARASGSLPCPTCTTMPREEVATLMCPQDCNVNPVYDGVVNSIKNTPVVPMAAPSGVVDVSYYLPADNVGAPVNNYN